MASTVFFLSLRGRETSRLLNKKRVVYLKQKCVLGYGNYNTIWYSVLEFNQYDKVQIFSFGRMKK